MLFTVNQHPYSFPSSLADITVGQIIAFNEEHGKILAARSQAIAEMTDEFDRDIEQSQLSLETAARTFSFHTGMPFATVSKEIDIMGLLEIYNTCRDEMFTEEQALKPQPSYQWKGETWVIAIPESLASDNITIKEFVASNNLVISLNGISKGNWTKMPYLCASCLRKEGESFNESMATEGSERMALMLELPLNIAIPIGNMLAGILQISNVITNEKSQNP